MPGQALSLFIFRRDLRLEDNTALRAALKSGRPVMPCFIFDPRQVGRQPYRSAAAIRFMLNSLSELETALRARGGKLYRFYGKAEDVVRDLVRKHKIAAVYLNADYTPFSRARDGAIRRVVVACGAEFWACHDTLLIEPDLVKRRDGGWYTMFTPFYKAALKVPVLRPSANRCRNYYGGRAARPAGGISEPGQPALFRSGGRSEAVALLRELKKFRGYQHQRDIPAIQGTTGLSPHIKFGTCSVREVYFAIRQQLGAAHPLIRQLYWRDFFSYIAWHYPSVFGSAFRQRYNGIEWDNRRRDFRAWCLGKTGFPFIDAGMRQLNTTGFMPNRLRMLTASFLVKDLHIDWRWGEKYFATRLVDYDPAVNNGNWQWAASTGCDAQPYFRIFNPWIQQKKFDPQARYIKTWVTELKEVPARVIHDWATLAGEYRIRLHYPAPIVDHREAAEAAEDLYLACR